MTRNKILFASFFVFLLGFSNCAKDGVNIDIYTAEDYKLVSNHLNLPNEPTDYTIHFPNYTNTSFFFSGSTRSFNDNLATLGRVLFYDENLSEDRSISCASCHKQELAFSDDVAFSKGILDRDTDRNSLALGSVFNFNVYYGNETNGGNGIPFFWDNRASTVQEQSKQTFANEKEMGMEIHEVVERVNEQEYYGPLFKAAFGESNQVTNDQVLDAVSEFINAMGSTNSTYDQALDKYYEEFGDVDDYSLINNSLPGFTAQQNLGKTLFVQNCASCHNATNSRPLKMKANNGLELEYVDAGIGDLPNASSSDYGMFKVPTLRNIALTGPYMHDGSLASLEDVIEHYSTGIKNHPNLSRELREGESSWGEPMKFNFSSEDKAALVAFLNTFTDETFLQDQRYANPFK